MIRLRQKSIRLADRSEFGWSVVTEYDADELAEDSDDEKKIEKAEKAAERKAFWHAKSVLALKFPRESPQGILAAIQAHLGNC